MIPKSALEDLRATLKSISENGAKDRGTEESRETPYVSNFFDAWFKRRHRAYYVVFRKNAKVTNLQFNELLTLLSDHVSPRIDEGLIISSSIDFRQHLGNLLESFSTNAAHHVTEFYGASLCRTVIVDAFFGSAAVFLPPWMSVDLAELCANSGYIHSAGYNIFIRRVSKADDKELETFKKSLNTHLAYIHGDVRSGNGHPIPDSYGRAGPSLFVVYAHEDFTPFDGEKRSELRDGLDDLKIYAEKYAFGKTSLVDVVTQLAASAPSGQLLVVHSGDYNAERRRAYQEGVRRDHTIWLLADRAIPTAPASMPGERYFICYNQIYRAESPFQIFDENKPGWLDHTTMPHSMCAAMVNLTKPWSNASTVWLCDPFAGTGTLGLEVSKDPRVGRVEQSDFCEASSVVAEDNFEIFAAPSVFLKGLVESLAERWQARPVDRGDGDRQRYEISVEDLPGANGPVGSGEDGAIRDEVIIESKKGDLATRVELYVARRAQRRHARAFLRETRGWKAAFAMEATRLLNQLAELLAFRTNEEIADRRETGSVAVIGNENVGAYSPMVTLSVRQLRAAHTLAKETGEPMIVHRDARLGGLGMHSSNVVVTDPPYGFNTPEEQVATATLYQEAFRASIRRLAADGHLIICLLDYSHVSAHPMGFARPNVVVRQILSLAQEERRGVYVPARLLPAPRWLYSAPYYWESERALRRSILHFRVRGRVP